MESKSDPTNSFCEEFITGLEELLLCDYTDFAEDHLPDPDALLDWIYTWVNVDTCYTKCINISNRKDKDNLLFTL